MVVAYWKREHYFALKYLVLKFVPVNCSFCLWLLVNNYQMNALCGIRAHLEDTES